MSKKCETQKKNERNDYLSMEMKNQYEDGYDIKIYATNISNMVNSDNDEY
jgi:hypothetical protein